MTAEEQLTNLEQARQWLEDAITTKGGEITTVSIPTGLVPKADLKGEIYFKLDNAEYRIELTPH